MLRKKQIYYYTTLQVSQRSTNVWVHERSKNNWIVTIWLKLDLCMTTSTTTNSELYKNEVKATLSNELVSLSPSPSLVELCAGSDSINVLSWSQVNMNTSCACVLVSKIAYDVENACSDHGIWILIWTWIWTLSLTFCLRTEMKTLSSCAMITYPLSMISWISSNMMRIPETWSMNCSYDQCLHLLYFFEI